METSTPLLIEAREAGRLLNMLPSRLVRLANRDVIPCVRLPDGEVRFSLDDLREFVNAHRRPATEAAR